jgi:NAD(P)-dependent dehydrogenase (short-subunit alcohol dehydrogenase family)
MEIVGRDSSRPSQIAPNGIRETMHKKALVTGGTKGIGAAIVHHLRESGYEVISTARGKEADYPCDVTSKTEVESLKAKVGAIDILINGAGGVRTSPFLKITEENWDWHFSTNVKSIFYCTQAFLPDMLQNKWGRIINISSTAGKIGGRYLSAYVATKHAVIGLTRSLALECAESGVTVNAVCPSFVDTPMTREGAKLVAERTGRTFEQIMDSFKRINPQNRFVTPEEVAHAVHFLIENSAVNGQSISLCGGETV